MSVVNKFRVLAIVFSISTVSAHATLAFDCTPSAVTQCLTFDNNLIPSDWTLINNLNVGRNVGVANGQLYVGQVDSFGGIYQAFNGMGASRVTVQYDSNLTNNFWGQSSTIMLTSSMASTSAMSQNFAQTGLAKSAYGASSQEYNVAFDSGNGQYQLPLHQLAGLTVGNYRVSATFQDGQVAMAVQNLDTSQQVFSGTVALPSFTLSSMNDLFIVGLDTTGVPTVIDNVKVTTSSKIIGALPAPTQFTEQVSAFAQNNQSTLAIVAAQSGNTAYQYSSGAQQLLNPQDKAYLKSLAEQAATNLEKSTALSTQALAAVDAVESSTSAGGVVTSFLRSTAINVATSLGYNKAEKTNSLQLQQGTQYLDFVSTLTSCLPDIKSPMSVTARLALCDANVINFDIGRGLVPLLQLYAFDPVSPDFKTIVHPAIPSVVSPDPAFQQTLDALLAAEIYLIAVNQTYDRYVGAYNAGATDSALLQIQAYLTYLSKYNDAVQVLQQGLAKLKATLANLNLDASASDIQSDISGMQQYLNTYGFDSDTLTALQDLGLDDTQIFNVKNDLLSFQYTSTGGMLDNMDALYAAVNSVSAPNDVPEPNTLYLMFWLLPMSYLIIRKRKHM